MSYIGSSATPIPVAFSGVRTQSFNGTGSQTVFTLSRSVGSNSEIEVVVNNVQQSPFDGSYVVAGTALTFSESPSAGTNNVYVIYRDQAVGSIVDTTAYRRNEVDSLLDDKEDTIGYTPVNKAGDTMSGALALPPGGLIVGTDQLIIDSSGYIRMPYQPVFQAYNTGNATQYGARIMPFTNTYINNGNHYDGVNKFTAPISGFYQFNTYVQLFNASSGVVTGLYFYKNGGQVTTGNIEMVNNGNSGHTNISGSQILFLSQNDYVQVYVGSTNRDLQSGFSGFLIG